MAIIVTTHSDAQPIDPQDDPRPHLGKVWITNTEPYGPCEITACPVCGMGLEAARAVVPNHCAMCGHRWTDLPPTCDACGRPAWPDGHWCPANPDENQGAAR